MVIYIVPATTNQAGQCRICATAACRPGLPAHVHYRAHPREWREVGLMNSQGRLVCFEGTPEQRAELIACQPLTAGLVFEL